MQRERKKWNESAMRRLIGETALAVQGASDADAAEEPTSLKSRIAS
jgi:hypothetical protein